MPNLLTAPTKSADFHITGYQKWRDLLFLHWRMPAEVVQALLPARLTVDTYDGFAWVGLVAFDMLGVRPKWFPAVPGISDFAETNVRTYVRHDDGEPAVWFFSLDAARSLPVKLARWKWHLNYFHSSMTIARDGGTIAYTGQRRPPTSQPAEYEISADLGEPIKDVSPESLEHFLVERYVLYTQKPDGMLLRASVRHVPYPLREVSNVQCRQTMTDAAGMAVDGPPSHAVFSPGVDVEIGRLEAVA